MSKLVSELLVRHPAMQYPMLRLATAMSDLRSMVGLGPANRIGCAEPMLIILGAGRSGNTLLRRLLMEKGRIYIPPESYVWCAIALSTMRSGALPWEDRVALVLGRLEYHPEFETFGVPSLRPFAEEAAKWPAHKRSTGSLLHGLYVWLAREKLLDAVWLGDKTPLNLMGVGLVSRLFPNGRYIYIERDGVDVAYSYKEAGIYHSLEDGARRWRNSRQAWLRFRERLPHSRYLEAKFDELVKDHGSVVDRVLSTFEIPKRAVPIDVSGVLGDVAIRDHHRSVRGAVEGRPQSNCGDRLSEADKVSLRKVFGSSLVNAGYSPV